MKKFLAFNENQINENLAVYVNFFPLFQMEKNKFESKLWDFLYKIDVISWESFCAFSLLLNFYKKYAPPKSIKYLKIVYLTCFSDPFHLMLICLLIHHLQMWFLYCLHARLYELGWMRCRELIGINEGNTTNNNNNTNDDWQSVSRWKSNRKLG